MISTIKLLFLWMVFSGTIICSNPANSQTYCFPGFQMACFYGDQITRVVFAGINHFDDVCNNDADGKKDFTNTVSPASVTAGNTYTLTVTFSVNSSVGAIAWFDFNDDGIFQAGESFNLGTRTSSGDLSVSVPIPANAAVGNTRFRIMIRKNNVNPMPGSGDACHSISNYRGQMKDYSFTINPGSSLPVGLKSFTSNKEDQTVKLNWVTESEQHNELFLVQHAADGINWTDLDEVASYGDSQNEQFYELLHRDPIPGTNYYQLFQKDKNGEWKFLDRTSIQIHLQGIQIYPNPFPDELSLSGLERNSEVMVFNAVWEEEKRYFFSQKQEVARLDLGELDSGIYFVVIKNGTTSRLFKLMKE
ncbi:hypothetical protein D3C87_516060 [compost metagenome]